MHRLLVIGVAALAALTLCGPGAAWTWPADGQVLRPFGMGPDPYAGGQHRGIDVAGADGSTIRAPAAGTVTFAGSLPDPRSQRHDPDRRRVRRHARPPRHDRCRERGRGGRGRPDRRNGIQWSPRASGAERPPRHPAVERRGGVCRPARTSPASGRARPDVRSRPDSGPVGFARCAAGCSAGSARRVSAAGRSAFARRSRRSRLRRRPHLLRRRLRCPQSRLRRRPRRRTRVAGCCELCARSIVGIGICAARNGGRTGRGRRGRRRGDRLTAAGCRGRSNGLAAGGSARPETRSARRARHRSGGGRPCCAEVGDSLDLAPLRGAHHRRSAGRVDAEQADAVAPIGRRVETCAGRARPDVVRCPAPRGACRPDGLRRSAEPHRGGHITAGARPRRDGSG